MNSKNKTLLITGGTGSFGHAVLDKYLQDDDFSEIRIFSRDEKKQDDMRHQLQSPKVKFYIGDVRDMDSLQYAMENVDYIFHAAALKQVPSCEFYPIEAVKTNVLGTENVLNSAIRNKVEKVICLSTDKAAYPINAMGISKAMMEKVAVAKSRVAHSTTITSTRYGNVMASRGSVIPLFIKQIKEGNPLTITNPEMTRFMMSLEQAVDLVMFSFDKGRSGDLFVQKAPAATIGQLAEVMLDIFNASNEIKVIGTRHGEKLYETLLTAEERVKSEDLGDYFRVTADDRDLNYGKYFSEGNEAVQSIEDYHSHNTKRLSNQELKEMILKLDYVQNQLTS
ncbi:MAG: polysaccharide biosynthesis protein [Schleiferiaceae bacterium]